MNQSAFKSLDAYRTVCVEGWLSSLQVKKWRIATIVRGDVKPSQQSGILYKTWVAIESGGAIVSGHCTCMAGISEVCNHVGALLYKCMQQRTDVSSMSQPNNWLPAKKSVHPAPACNLVFKTPKLDKCSSQIIKPKEVVHSVKTASTQLREPTEEEQEYFFLKLSQLDHKASILSIHLHFNKPFIPISQSRSLPEPITLFANADGMKIDTNDIVPWGVIPIKYFRVLCDL